MTEDRTVSKKPLDSRAEFSADELIESILHECEGRNFIVASGLADHLLEKMKTEWAGFNYQSIEALTPIVMYLANDGWDKQAEKLEDIRHALIKRCYN